MKNVLARNIRKHVSIGALSAGVFLLSFGIASAATLFVSPQSGTHAVGETFTISVVLSSADQSVNAVSGTLSFPGDLLQVVSLSKNSSVVSFWIQEPTYSNTSGTVEFSGIIPNPGFIGASGTILSVTFHVIAQGQASISIGNDAQVLANDGSGTDILKSVSGATAEATAAQAHPQKEQSPANPPPAKVQSTPAPQPSTTASTSPEVLEAPVITGKPERVPLGSSIEVTGTSAYPGATARLTLASETSFIRAESTIDSDGSFTIMHDPISQGSYQATVRVIDSHGTESVQSGPFTIVVGGPGLLSVLMQTFEALGISLGILLLIVGFIAILGFFWWRFKRYQREVERELQHIDATLHQSLLVLKEDMNQFAEELEEQSTQRKLTAAEARFIRRIREHVTKTGQAIEGEIKVAHLTKDSFPI